MYDSFLRFSTFFEDPYFSIVVLNSLISVAFIGYPLQSNLVGTSEITLSYCKILFSKVLKGRCTLLRVGVVNSNFSSLGVTKEWS